jgi:aminocarboxymuconate-semialdehyde decarboxylase
MVARRLWSGVSRGISEAGRPAGQELTVPIIDVHAHVTPERFKSAIAAEGTWFGVGPAAGELDRGGFAKSLDERIADMDALGVDMQLVSPTVGFYQYSNDLDVTKRIARECNDEIAEMVAEHPTRFAGLATLPMQDLPSAITEMERVIGERGLRGVMISDHVLGRTYDEPEFRPFFQAVEDAGAVVLFHQASDTVVHGRIKRYKLGNAVGNMAERALLYATLVFGGVMDRFPKLNPILAHGGGYTAFGIVRMDKVAGALEEGGRGDGLAPPFPQVGDDQVTLSAAPSSYLERFYYDCCVYSGRLLRFIIDTVGIDRVVLGTDYPAPMLLPDAVRWINGLKELSTDEKEKILTGNATQLLGL